MSRFASDNNAGLCPEALAAITDANEGHCVAYGDDDYTLGAKAEFARIFGDSASVWFVATGTAANTLAIAALTRPWQRVLCYVHSHYNYDESTAPERITQCRTTVIVNDTSKITPQEVIDATNHSRLDVHVPQPGVLTISNTTELGTIYTPDEMTALCDVAHDAGYRVHVDGTRFANAVAALGCDPRELSIDAGVDALSFGGTKNGLAFGEAVLLFPQSDGEVFATADKALPFLRKSTGHLLSKHRFVAAPFSATLRDDRWLHHASHANNMAAKLSAGFEAQGCELRYQTQANAIFITLKQPIAKALLDKGHFFYPFGVSSWNLYRFMCSFDTTPEQVDGLLADLGEILGR